jgi:hypothetical protein
LVRLTYSKHARERMRRRRITEEDVERALNRTVGDRPGEPGTIWINGVAASGQILSVCVTLADRRFVVTVAWQD